MSETTTTDALDTVPAEPTGSQADTTNNPAEAPAEETQPDPSGEVETVQANAETDEHLAWLKDKGIDPDDPDFKSKVAKAYRESEKAMHQSRQEAKNQLRDAATEAVQENGVDTELNDEVRALRVSQQVRDFKDGLREKGYEPAQITEYEAKMAELINEDPRLATRLDAAFALVREADHEAAIVAAEKRGRAAKAAEIAKSSVAGTPKGNASTATSVEEVDPGVAAFRAEMNRR